MPNCGIVVIAVDTNVVIRLLTGDDPPQTLRVRRLFESEMVFLPKTVLLEAEWVLRRLYGLDPASVVKALERLVSLPNVRCEDETPIRQALNWSLDGMDFADALHLASSRTASRFATFDRHMIQTSARTGLVVGEP
jgi:predicted nucleic-acid-binding protein